jgi:predicted O-methyltransferase YrrM
VTQDQLGVRVVRPNEGPITVGWPLGHHYSPVPDTRELAREPVRSRVWPPEPHPTPGIDWRDDFQRALCADVFAPQTAPEFPSSASAGRHEYFFDNAMFAAMDASILQALLRHLKPAQMIEVGAGFSSLVSAQVNRDFLGGAMRLTCIDPNPRDFLLEGVDGISELRPDPVQQTPLELFGTLSRGDVLFIDTSHTVKTGGDVPWIYHQILPRLQEGVYVHIHDVFLPGDYPEEWVIEKGWGWNELYLVQSFLTFNSAFEIVFGAQWMIQHHWDELVRAFPMLSERPRPGSSLWIRRRETDAAQSSSG